MKVLYDYQAFTFQDFGGISRYYVNLIDELLEEADFSAEIPFFLSNNIHLQNSGWQPKHSQFLPKVNMPGKNFAKKQFNSLYFRQASLRIKADLYHATYYENFPALYQKMPMVMTIHDFAKERNLKEFGSDVDDLLKAKNSQIRQASGIICISEFTKQDLMDRFPELDEDKVAVIHHGANLINQQRNAPSEVFASKIPNEFILFVGNRGGYKNFPLFLRSIAKVLAEREHLHLVCVAKKPFSAEEVQLISELGLDAKVLFFYVSDVELSYLYSKAKAFVFPSLLEGFGMPILEAFSHNCPAIISRASCFPEVAGEAAEYFDPMSQAEIESALFKIIDSEGRRSELIQKGQKRLKAFSWELAATKTKKFYQKIINQYA